MQMKHVMMILAIAILAGGCGPKKRTPQQTQSDVVARINAAGMDYNSIQSSGGMIILDMRFRNISDISFLRGLPICGLSLNGNPITDLSPLAGMPLTQLDVSETKISSIAALQGMKLASLGLEKTEVSDLSPVRGMPLTWLSICKSKNITDISALSGMTTLKTLNVSGTGITDISPVSGMSLETMWFSPSKVKKGVDVVKGMSSIKALGSDNFQTTTPQEFFSYHKI